MLNQSSGQQKGPKFLSVSLFFIIFAKTYFNHDIMTQYLIKKYGKGLVLAILFFLIGFSDDQSFNSGMMSMVCVGFFVFLIRIIMLAKSGNSKKVVSMGNSLILSGLLVLYVVTLKPLRRLIRHLRYGTFWAKPYPYLAMYGSATDSHAMLSKFTPHFHHPKAPAAKAILWRLLVNGSLYFSTDAHGQTALFLYPSMADTQADGIDRALEETVYRFLQQAQEPDGTLYPEKVKKVICYYPNPKDKTERKSFDYKNQYRFADLLNTGIGLNSYTREEVNHLFGMKRFLKGLPGTFSPNYFKGEMLLLEKIWPEYMTYAYLFGIEKTVFSKLCNMLPTSNDSKSLLPLLRDHATYRKVLHDMMHAIDVATPEAEDSVAGRMGRVPLAWHVDEIYDI